MREDDPLAHLASVSSADLTDQPLPAGLVAVPISDRRPSELVVAWPKSERSPLVRSFVQVAENGWDPEPRPGTTKTRTT